MKKLYLFLLSLLFCPVAFAGSSQDGRLLYDIYDTTALSAVCDRLSENSDKSHKYVPIVGQYNSEKSVTYGAPAGTGITMLSYNLHLETGVKTVTIIIVMPKSDAKEISLRIASILGVEDMRDDDGVNDVFGVCARPTGLRPDHFLGDLNTFINFTNGDH